MENNTSNAKGLVSKFWKEMDELNQERRKDLVKVQKVIDPPFFHKNYHIWVSFQPHLFFGIRELRRTSTCLIPT